VIKEGQQIPVKLLEIDKMGRLNLSYIDAIDPNGANESGKGGRREDHSGKGDARQTPIRHG
jgi:polyribonucleotide nucleotidyltransferase